jgi:hypothetical protein
MGKRSFKKDCSGQVIIITALLVAVLLLSTALYVIEVGKDVPTVDASQGSDFLAYKQSAKSTLISALSNVTDGGNPNILGTDLSKWQTAILSNSYQDMLTIEYNTLNSSSYQKGFWISWGTNGQGVSSAYASFVFASSNPSATSILEYALNVTSSISSNGNFRQIDNITKQATLTVKVLNEGQAALAQNFTVSYQNATDWVKAPSPSITNFGNGTYTLQFDAETAQLNDPLAVSLLCQDQRSIFVEANLTCTGT